MKDVVIIGGGLAGLSAAYYLQKENNSVQILEANDYIGGRIKTVSTLTGAALELGATWIFYDSVLKTLLKELKINLYEQYTKGDAIYESVIELKPQRFNAHQMTGGQRYHKVVGGTSKIIDALAQVIGSKNIKINTVVTRVIDKGDYIEVQTNKGELIKAKKIIVAIPPKLLQSSIIFDPLLTDKSNEIRKNTHTWMGESTKFSVEYKSPFWREKNMAGLALSMAGLVREVQDHVNGDNTAYALVGFLNLKQEHYHMSKKERKSIVIKDLVRLFGQEAQDVIAYEDLIWNIQAFTSPYFNLNENLSAHQNNGNKELIKPQMNNKLFFAGAETSNENSGYMEGAVISAQIVAQNVSQKILSK